MASDLPRAEPTNRDCPLCGGSRKTLLYRQAVEVQALPLDELSLPGRVAYLKMDVEGAESEALAGAPGLIARDQPALAISLYHRSEDLWRLPGRVRELLPSHSFYLRRYADCGFELVLYAVPPASARGGIGPR